MIYVFPKIDLLGKNGACPEVSNKKPLNNLIKFILKPILSQFDVASVQNAFTDMFSGFNRHRKNNLGLERHVKTF